MKKYRDELVIGGLYIPDSGGVNLYDFILGVDTGQDLVSQAYQDTPTLYIPLHPSSVKAFEIIGYRYGYVDGANADDLANVWLIEGASATDYINQMYTVLATGALSETPLTAIGTYVEVDTPIPIYLQDDGKLYFKTNWTTAVIDCGAGEHFFFIVYGKILDTPGI